MTTDTAPTLQPRERHGDGPSLPGVLLCAGLAAMAAPVLWLLAADFWRVDEQGYGPVIVAAALWLMWQRRARYAALTQRPAPFAGGVLLVVAVLASVIGRSQAVLQFEVGAPILAAAAVLLLLRGWAALRLMTMPLVFLLFVVPWPGVLVQAVTGPLKLGVSAVAELLLGAAGYPVARTGVVLAVDQYHLLVADACAGLTSMFTLEALGLVYVDLRGHASRLRNALLAVLVVPIAFAANVVRVVVLVLVTYHLGESAGQGFLHGFAGLVLFVVAGAMLFATDAVLARLPGGRGA